MRNAALTALITSLLLALAGVSLAVSERAQTSARLDQRLALQADGEADAVGGVFASTRLALRLLAKRRHIPRRALPQRAPDALRRHQPHARLARAGRRRSRRGGLGHRPRRTRAGARRAAAGRRRRRRSRATSATTRSSARRSAPGPEGTRLRALSLGGHGTARRLQLGARARRRPERHSASCASSCRSRTCAPRPRPPSAKSAVRRSRSSIAPAAARSSTRRAACSRGSAGPQAAYGATGLAGALDHGAFSDGGSRLAYRALTGVPAGLGWVIVASSPQPSLLAAAGFSLGVAVLLAFSLALAIAGLISLRAAPAPRRPLH